MFRAVVLSSLLLVAMGLVACASPGNESLRDESETSVQNKMVEGKTSKAEVRSMFGEPLHTGSTEAGLEVWTYEFKGMSADGVSYVPVVNWFAGTASGTKKQLVVVFDEQSLVKRYAMNESEVTENTGAFNR